eukprot:2748508-Lingulodinium_polyedra.AAC.1
MPSGPWQSLNNPINTTRAISLPEKNEPYKNLPPLHSERVCRNCRTAMNASVPSWEQVCLYHNQRVPGQ